MSKPAIFLIDSDTAQRAEVASTLASAGFVVLRADDWQVLSGAAPPLSAVLTADGPDSVAAAFRSTRMSGLRIPVLAYGCKATPHEIVRLHSAGAADYLERPFDGALIAAAIRAAAASADAWAERSSGTGLGRRSSAG